MEKVWVKLPKPQQTVVARGKSELARDYAAVVDVVPMLLGALGSLVLNQGLRRGEAEQVMSAMRASLEAHADELQEAYTKDLEKTYEYEELAALVEFHTSALGRRIAAKQADNSNFHRAFASVETLARQILGIGPVGES